MVPRQRLIIALLLPLTAIIVVLLGGLLARPEPVSPADVRLAPSAYLSLANIQWLQLIALAPLFIALIFIWRSEYSPLEFLQPEMFGAFGVWISLVNGYAVAYMLTLTGGLPKFDPPIRVLNDPRLLTVPVNYLALGLILSTLVFYIWFIFFRQRGFGGLADRIVLPYRRVALLALLAMLAIMVWLFGGLTFALLMIPPAWLWILIEPRPSRVGKVLNSALAVAGIAAIGVMVFWLPAGLTAWSLVLAAAYGTFFPFDVLMFCLLAALFIRFLRLGLSAPAAERIRSKPGVRDKGLTPDPPPRHRV